MIKEVLTTCPKCGGKKELDFGFYKRPCEKCEGQGQVDDGRPAPRAAKDAPARETTHPFMGGRHDDALRKIAAKNDFEWTLYGSGAVAGRWDPGFRDNETGTLVLYFDGSVWRTPEGSVVPFDAVDDLQQLDAELAAERKFLSGR